MMRVMSHAATQRQEPLSNAAIFDISVVQTVSVISRIAGLGKAVIIWADVPILV